MENKANETKLPFEKNIRQVFERVKVNNIIDAGKKPEERTIPELLDEGVIVINKPAGPTSHQVSSYVQKILNIKKSGHTGTLDPNVTGVLSVTLNSATKIVEPLLTAGKEYICMMHVHKEFTEYEIRKVIKKYVGKIKQLPPVRCAVKRAPRYRRIYYIKILDIKDKDVLMQIGCQAGTYIRKICSDIGVDLKCGAHMAQLIRTKAGPFNTNHMISLQELTDAFHFWKEDGDESYLKKYLLPIEKAVEHLPKIWISDQTVASLTFGHSLKVPGVVKVESDIEVGDRVAIMTLKEELVMTAHTLMTSKQILNEKKGIACKTERVFMKTGIYPRFDRKSENIGDENNNLKE